jgi:hypothetical protein
MQFRQISPRDQPHILIRAVMPVYIYFQLFGRFCIVDGWAASYNCPRYRGSLGQCYLP